MNRKILFLASLSLMATPFVSLVAAPARAMPRDISKCPQGNPSEFVHAVTKNFDVYICGGDLAHVYVGVPKNGSGKIVLPLENTEGGDRFTFVAVNNANNGYYRYVLSRNRLTVTNNGTTIVSEAARWD